MAYVIINSEHDYVQYSLMDFIEGLTREVIDCSTQEGKTRRKEISAPRASNSRKTARSRGLSNPQSQDIHFLSKNVLNERSRRLFAGFLARSIGFGGTQMAARLTGLDKKTVRRGVRELDKRDIIPDSRIRRKGGGRRAKAEVDPRYEPELLCLIEDETGGDPMRERRWVRKDLRWMRKSLEAKGIKVSLGTIRNSLKKHGISLKKNKKSRSTQDHPGRDGQFQLLNKLKRLFLGSGKPVISVDCKKKELIGNFKNDGKAWRKKAIEVLDHDFPNPGIGRLVPYGIYDLKNNEGHVYCGTSFETSGFAVDCICRWWEEYGQRAYPGQHKLLILCDSGGSNGYKRRAWKRDLQTKLADRFGLEVYVCHYPPGASKYNPIEHRLFPHVTRAWSGVIFRSLEIVTTCLRRVWTRTGLKVTYAVLDKTYELKRQASDRFLESYPIRFDKDRKSVV